MKSGFRALKLWLSFQVYGAAAFRRAIERSIDLGCRAERGLTVRGQWRTVSLASLAIVAFRFDGAENEHENDRVTGAPASRLVDDGFAMLSTTTLEGRPALRFRTINPSTEGRDIDETIDRLEALAGEVLGPERWRRNLDRGH